MLDSEKSMIPISNFMTRTIKSVSSETSIKEAAKIMYDNHIPSLLIEDHGSIIGIITYEDIAIALSIYDHSSISPVREIMSSPIMHVTPNSSVLKAVELMLEKKIHKLVVMDEGNPQGIISSTDLMVLFSILNEKQLYDVFKNHISK